MPKEPKGARNVVAKKKPAASANPRPVDALPAFLSLDFVYVPCSDPERDFDYYTKVLGGVPIFRIKAMNTEVAGIRLSQDGPLVLLAEHLEGAIPVLVYRVENFKKSKVALRRRGWKPDDEFEIPHGPCAIFAAAGGQRLAIYELTRPDANEHFAGRFDV